MGAEGFSAAVSALRLPLPASSSMARIIGMIELSLGVIAVVWQSWAAAPYGGTAYMIFATVLERARRSGATGDCRCFGALRARVDGAAVMRNTALAVGALVLVCARGSEFFPNYPVATASLAVVVESLAGATLDTFLVVRRSSRSG
ncbi:MAG: MauE/DoxX family redox-associated membrane protein [Deltaproteobacteria bacterium]